MLPFGGLAFFFFPSCYGQSQSKFADSIAFYDHVLSFQSLLPLDSQIMISRKAEAYAKGHGETYKSYVYAVRRGALYFSLDSNARCEELNKRLIPEIEERVAMDPSPQWKELLVDCYSNLALSLIYGEKTDSAMRIYQNLYSRFEKDSNTSLRAKCLNGIGATFAYRSYIDVALNYFKHALSEYERARNQRGIYLACSNIGTSYLDQGKYREALPYCTRSYQIAEQEGYHGAESITSAMTMGYIHAGLKQYEIANTYFANALERTLKGNFRHLEGYVTMVTRQGLIKRTPLSQYANIRKSGLIAIALNEGDSIAWTRLTSGNDTLIAATRNGQAIRFYESDARPMGRGGHGVRAIRLEEGDEVVGVAICREGATVLTVTEQGKGRRTRIEDYRLTGRGGKGIRNYDAAKDKVAGIKVVDEADDVLLSSQEGVIIRMHAADITVQSRYGGGVRVMRLGDTDRVTVVARTDHDDEAETAKPEQEAGDAEPTAEELAALEAAEEAAAAEAPAPDDGAEE